MEQKMNTTK